MREIKFRAWCGKYIWPWKKIKEWGNIFDQEDLVLMQFTGLKDKNGVEIYEGDILQYEGSSAYGWDGRKSKIIVGGDTTLGDSENLFLYGLGWMYEIGEDTGKGCRDIEVIGNIYENYDVLHAVPALGVKK